MCIIAINGGDPITYQGTLDELNDNQTPCGKSKVDIGLFRRKSCQRTDLEEICSNFDQVRPVVSHIKVGLLKKAPTAKNIGEGLRGPQRQFMEIGFICAISQ